MEMQALDLRGNLRFELDIQSKKVLPVCEVVVLGAAPEYLMPTGKGAVKKSFRVERMAMTISLEKIDLFIAGLKFLRTSLANMDDFAGIISDAMQSGEGKTDLFTPDSAPRVSDRSDAEGSSGAAEPERSAVTKSATDASSGTPKEDR